MSARRVAWFRGRLVPEAEARVSFRDYGFQVGDGVFDTARTVGHKPFMFAEHIARLYRSLGYVGIDPGLSPEAMLAATLDVLRANVPGIHIPDSVIERLEKAEKPGEEGKKLCIELIQQIRGIEGVAGVHVMAYRREHLVGEIIEESGILRERLAAKEQTGV